MHCSRVEVGLHVTFECDDFTGTTVKLSPIAHANLTRLLLGKISCLPEGFHGPPSSKGEKDRRAWKES